ncbi:MAG: GAF domain-containing sensor histidine kinase [Actinomycetota bacterium]|nr:GAF domain-containing sensor histidine kinase [Actinomycetota bacterium]
MIRGDDEERRLEAVRRYDILDTPPDGAFDRVTALAARFCDVPISTITIVDRDRIWFKSTCGIDVDQIPRDRGLCASAILRDEPYVVTDAGLDPRTLDNPLVRGELGLRFYVAVPLTTSDGYNLGTLNIIDVEPRDVDSQQLETLSDLAAIVIDELELRLAARRTVEFETERANAQFREQVLAGLSHDMRTPLAILRGTVDLEDGVGSLDPERRRIRHLARRQIRHLDWLVRQFLDYAQLEEDRRVTVHVAPIDLAELVTDAVDVFTDRARIDVRVASDRPALADRDRVLQILIELLNNAVRFAGLEMPIEVSVEDQDDGSPTVSVADRGPGIEATALPRLFEKFYRSDRSSGSGIGLYVSRALAEAQGGRLGVQSTPGQGTCFTLVLRAAHPTSERSRDPSHDRVPSSR